MPGLIQPTKSPLYTPNGIRLDKLFAMPVDTIIDPADRDKSAHRYWRAQTMGAVALNLSEGRDVINTGGGNVTHWSDDYDWVRRTAETMAEWGVYSDNQFTREDQEKLAKRAGIEIGDLPRLVLPIGIVALRDNLEIPPAPDGFPGFKHETPVGLHQLDPHSITAIQDIFEVPVAPPNI